MTGHVGANLSGAMAFVGIVSVYLFGLVVGYYILGARARRDRDRLREEGETTGEALEGLRREVERLRTALIDREAELSGLEDEKDRLGESLRKSTDAQETIKATRDANEALSKSLHDCTAKFVDVSAENEKLRAENNRLREVSRDSQDRLIQFRDETVERLRASNDRNATERAQALGRAKKAEQERDIALEALESVRARVEDVLNPPVGAHLDDERDDDE